MTYAVTIAITQKCLSALRYLYIIIFVALALFILSGCDNNKLVRTGDPSPAISAQDLHGKLIDPVENKGKFIIIYFWANSCCGDKLEQLEPLYLRYRSHGLEILAINGVDSVKELESYLLHKKVTFPILPDEQFKLLKKFRVLGYPTIFIVDTNGIIREKIMGDIPVEKLEKLLLRQFAIQKKMEAEYEKLHSR